MFGVLVVSWKMPLLLSGKKITRGASFNVLAWWMGLSWLFGIIPNFWDIDSLWYVFALANALQDVHIVLAFGIFGKVRGIRFEVTESNGTRTDRSNTTWLIESKITWPNVSRCQFWMHFLEIKLLYYYSNALTIVCLCPINKKPTLVKKMTRRWTGGMYK